MGIMFNSRFASVIWASLLLSFILFPQYADGAESNFHHLTEYNDAKVYPLAPVNWDSCKDVKLYDRQFLKLHFDLKNISDKQLTINFIKSTCPCLVLEKELSNIELAPGAVVPVDFTLNGKKLKLGPFNRVFLVDVEGFREATMKVTGENVKVVDFEPKQILQLGRFIGDVPWKRTVTIVSLLDDDSMNILPPAPHDLLNVVVTKSAPKRFKVDISPKGALPFKKNMIALQFPVEGIPNYGPAEIGVLFEPTGWQLQAENTTIAINKDETNLGEPYVAKVKLILAKAPPKQTPKHYWGNKPPKDPLEDNPNVVVVSVADNEEEKAHPLSSPETWKPLLDKIVFPSLPENVKAEKIPSKGGIVLTFTLPAGFFNEERAFVGIPVNYNGSQLTTLNIVAQ